MARNGRANSLVDQIQQIAARLLPQAHNADIPAAAAPALNHVAMIGREARGKHVGDLRGRAAKILRKLVALYVHLFLPFFEQRFDKSFYAIG